MHSQVVDMSDANPFFSSHRDIGDIIKPLIDLDIIFFTFSRVDKEGGRIYLTNQQPDFLRSYFKEKYYLMGNTEGCPTHYKEQMIFWDTLPNQQMYDAGIRSRNVDHGIYIIEPHANHCDFFGLATRKGNINIYNTYINQVEYLKKFTQYFKEQAKPLIDCATSKKVIFPFNKDVVDLTLLCKQDNHFMILQRDQRKVKITARQFQIAENFLQGKSLKEIGKTLNLSPRTVESHLIHLKQKLHCENRTKLVIELTKIIYPS